MKSNLLPIVPGVLTAIFVALLTAQMPALARVEKIGKSEGAVDILAWPSYLERGEAHRNFDWVTDFEAKTGCKVNVRTATTSEEDAGADERGAFRPA